MASDAVNPTYLLVLGRPSLARLGTFSFSPAGFRQTNVVTLCSLLPSTPLSPFNPGPPVSPGHSRSWGAAPIVAPRSCTYTVDRDLGKKKNRSATGCRRWGDGAPEIVGIRREKKGPRDEAEIHVCLPYREGMCIPSLAPPTVFAGWSYEIESSSAVGPQQQQHVWTTKKQKGRKEGRIHQGAGCR